MCWCRGMHHPLRRRTEYRQCHLAVVQVEGALWFHPVYPGTWGICCIYHSQIESQGNRHEARQPCSWHHTTPGWQCWRNPCSCSRYCRYVFWLADGCKLAIECSTNMRKVPFVLKTLSNLPPAVCHSWSAEDFLGVLFYDGIAHLGDEHADSIVRSTPIEFHWLEGVTSCRSVIAIFRPGSNGRRYLKHTIYSIRKEQGTNFLCSILSDRA